MSLKKDLFFPIIVRITVFGMISVFGYFILSKNGFLQENSRKELVQGYKVANMAIQKSLDAQKRLFSEVESSFFVRSDYFSNQVSEVLQYNDDFINSEFTISVYGDRITKSIFNELKIVTKDINSSLYRYKKYNELLGENTPRLCKEGAYENKAVLKTQKKALRSLIACENNFRQTIPIYIDQLNCGLEKLQNDYNRILDKKYIPNYWKKICREESEWEYLNYYNEKYAYYHLQNDLKTDPDVEMMDNIVKDIDDYYEIKMIKKSLEFCE